MLIGKGEVEEAEDTGGGMDRVGVGELALDGVLLQSYDEGTECLA